MIVYIDGSCRGNGSPDARAGIGICSSDGIRYSKNVTKELGKCTNQRAELLAAITALDIYDRELYPEVELRSDSMYLVNGINEWMIKWILNDWKTSKGSDVENMDLWIALVKRIDNRRVKFVHVDGHSNNEFNNIADKLATSASARDQ
jgi:ribonuclease HI